MRTHDAEKSRKSLASLLKRHGEKMLSMSDKELEASIDATMARFGKILKKHS